jgi:hypothetical protein
MGKRFVDWLFRSRETGKLTIAQLPNAPLALFIAFRFAQALVSPHGTVHDALHWLAIAALAWWGLDELFRGVNPFRRILGAAVLASLILSLATGVAV